MEFVVFFGSAAFFLLCFSEFFAVFLFWCLWFWCLDFRVVLLSCPVLLVCWCLLQPADAGACWGLGILLPFVALFPLVFFGYQ